MSKRNATGPQLSRKRKKAGASYARIDLDALSAPAGKVEDIRVWGVSMSETTGRISATRRDHKHVYESSTEPLHKEPLTPEDISPPADPEPSELPPAKSVTKRKRVRVRKENDSVSSIQCLQPNL